VHGHAEPGTVLLHTRDRAPEPPVRECPRECEQVLIAKTGEPKSEELVGFVVYLSTSAA
jgi:hypothetical protein